MNLLVRRTSLLISLDCNIHVFVFKIHMFLAAYSLRIVDSMTGAALSSRAVVLEARHFYKCTIDFFIAILLFRLADEQGERNLEQEQPGLKT